MIIYTKYKVGETVFKRKPQTLAYKVESIQINITKDYSALVYNLTRNLSTDYPSGGDLSDVLEEQLFKDPK